MVRITIDASLPDKLSQLQEPAELFTVEGRRLGHFRPEVPTVLTVADARARDMCPFSEEELEAARSELSEGRSLAEIWKELGRQ